ncbi:hypothetical protein HY025_00940 [Candidatus Daviesbacteria bacterium]|nr:hypothetical protein [Candidatus Daviesbacteria bacterium]
MIEWFSDSRRIREVIRVIDGVRIIGSDEIEMAVVSLRDKEKQPEMAQLVPVAKNGRLVTEEALFFPTDLVVVGGLYDDYYFPGISRSQLRWLDQIHEVTPDGNRTFLKVGLALQFPEAHQQMIDAGLIQALGYSVKRKNFGDEETKIPQPASILLRLNRGIQRIFAGFIRSDCSVAKGSI